MKTTRRDFLALSAAGLALSSAGCFTPTDQNSLLSRAKISERTLKEAEKLAGVNFTDTEREQLLEGLESQLSRTEALRNLGFDNGFAPAMTLDLQLPYHVANNPALFIPSAVSLKPLPDNDEDIAYAAITDLSAWIRNRQLSSSRLTEIYLSRLKKFGPKLECVITITEDLARQQAAQADKDIAAGNYRGLLHGIPWGAKDLLDTKDILTTWGAMPYKNRIATRDARVVTLLEQAGAVLVAKTTMGALANGDVWFGGKTRNPWNEFEGSSGSSAGSASATAAGLVGFSIGTETLGSIVSPATRCGVVGLRPTFGRVSRTGAMVLSWSMDKIGPICRSVEDTAIVLNAINGYDPEDVDSVEAPFHFDASASIQGIKIGYSPAWFEKEEHSDKDREVLALLKGLGAELVEITLPDLPYDSLRIILYIEAAAAFEDLIRSNKDDLLVRQDVNAWPNRLRQGWFVSAVDLLQAQRLRRKVMQVMDDVYKNVELIVNPPSGGPILTITNFTGHPSLTLPTRLIEIKTRQSPSGSHPEKIEANPELLHKVPHSITFTGKLFEEGRILNLGMVIENNLNMYELKSTLN